MGSLAPFAVMALHQMDLGAMSSIDAIPAILGNAPVKVPAVGAKGLGTYHLQKIAPRSGYAVAFPLRHRLWPHPAQLGGGSRATESFDDLIVWRT